MLSLFLPAIQNALGNPLIRAAAQYKRILLPDAAAGQVEPCCIKCLPENQALGIRVKDVNARIISHDIVHTGHGLQSEIQRCFIIQVVILNRSCCSLVGHKVRQIAEHQIYFFTLEQFCIRIRQRGVTAVHPVFSEHPQIAWSGKTWLFHSLVDVEVIILDIFIVDVAEQLRYLRSLEAREIQIVVLVFQVLHQVRQFRHIPITSNLVHSDVECLLFRLAQFNDDAFDFRLTQMFQNRKALMSRYDCIAIGNIHNDQFNIAKVLD